MHKKIIVFLIIILILNSCNIINPEEKIPAYLQIDGAKIITNISKEGTNSHAICDSWIYVNGKFIGAFENPTQNIPILESGRQKIEINPGIKENSSSSYRVNYPMLASYTIDTVLKESEIIKLSPEFQYYSNINFALLEDFENDGINFQTTEKSVPLQIIRGEKAFEGKSMYFIVDNNDSIFEARTMNLLTLPKLGYDVYLEINYKCNGYFSFGFFDRYATGGIINEIRKNVFHFNPSNGQWKKTYINLKTHLQNAQGIEFRPFFICDKTNTPAEEKVEVYIDNVKILFR
ncbi:MAG: hypothetical protein LBV69_07445 [Bacteroidales bacterium]|nr:hypothetical protein [Bacteroidales bacterium]